MRRMWAIVLSVTGALAQAQPQVVESDPLEAEALVAPTAVLAKLPARLQAARDGGDHAAEARLELARANACRVIADWPCQRDAGSRAREAAEAAGVAALAIRGLVAEARAAIALQDYSIGERLLGQAEDRLVRDPAPALAADVQLAWSSLAYGIGKHALAAERAQRGLALLPPGAAPALRVRLLRNLGRAQALSGAQDAARASFAAAQAALAGIDDPKLAAEIALEQARLARQSGDLAGQREAAGRIRAHADALGNTQLDGLAEETLGAVAAAAGDPATAARHFAAAQAAYARLGLERDELRVLGEQIRLAAPGVDVAAAARRYLDLDSSVERRDRAQAADDFDAQRRYARQDAELATLQADALLAQQREAALDQQRRLWIFLVALGVFAFLAVLGGWWLQQHANARLRIAVRAARASEARAAGLLRESRGFVLLHDPHGVLSMVNPSAAAALGIRADAAVGRPLAEFLAPGGSADYEAYLDRLAADQQAEATLVVQSPTGPRHWRIGSRLAPDAGGAIDVIATAVDVTDDLARNSRLHDAAVRDPLTGAANRRALPAFEATHAATGWAAVAIDLDHFKQINDRDGHEAGDRVLVEMAAFLTARVRSGDVVVRLGGDEFALLLGNADDAALDATTERLARDAAKAPCGFSVGAAVRTAGEPLDATLARADAAMYARKRASRA